VLVRLIVAQLGSPSKALELPNAHFWQTMPGQRTGGLHFHAPGPSRPRRNPALIGLGKGPKIKGKLPITAPGTWRGPLRALGKSRGSVLESLIPLPASTTNTLDRP
jgi:hypothetical protein